MMITRSASNSLHAILNREKCQEKSESLSMISATPDFTKSRVVEKAHIANLRMPDMRAL